LSIVRVRRNADVDPTAGRADGLAAEPTAAGSTGHFDAAAAMLQAPTVDVHCTETHEVQQACDSMP